MVEEIISKHKNDRNMISVLQSIQNKFGYIPKDETEHIAKALQIPLVRLWGVATFYSQFKLAKAGKYNIQICNGTACHVNNSDALIEAVQDELKIQEKETTEDGLFSYELVNCIGACARSPAIMINEKVYGNLSDKDIKKIISDLKKKEDG